MVDNTPEDSIKMSIKLYSFIEQKTDNWQDEYRFKCADNSINTYLIEVSSKDENGKAIRMIRAIKISQSKRRRAAT
jgi:hypothetical protein